MKTIIKGMIAVLSVIMIGLAVFLAFALTAGTDGIPMVGGWVNDLSERRMINSQTESLDQITGITIKSRSSDVFLLKSDTDELLIKEYISNKSVKKPFFTLSRNGSTIVLESDEKMTNNWSVFGSNYRYIEVYLPDSFKGAVKISSSSGDVAADGVWEFLEYIIRTASGDAEFDTVTADRIEIDTSSGDVYAEELNGQKDIKTQSGSVSIIKALGDVRISTSSGDIEMNSLEGKLDVKTSSGSVWVNQLDGSARARTTSGDVDLIITRLEGSVDIETSSGEVSCIIPKEAGFQFDATTSSGDIETYFDNSLSFNKKGSQAAGQVGPSSDNNIRVKTTSGDIEFSY